MVNREVLGPSLNALALAAAVLLLSWLAVGVFVDPGYRDSDTPVYERYGESIERGQVPYRDFALEYPPGAAAVFVAPALMTEDPADYMFAFETLMVLCALVALVATRAALVRLGASKSTSIMALLAIAISPLALATIALDRYDFLPAALVSVWLALALRDRHRLAAAVLGLGIVVKLYPLALLPIGFLWVRHKRNSREAAVGAAVSVAVCALCFLPFFVLAPSGVVDSLLGQLQRPLQVESLGASLLLASHRLFDLKVAVETSSGSVNLVGGVADILAAASGAMQVALVLTVYAILASRVVLTPHHLVLASAAVVTALVATGKVLSPQFLLWLIVLVPLAPAITGRVATLACLFAMLLTTSWFPFRYFALTQAAPLQTALLLTRNMILLGVLALLIRRLGRARTI